MPRFSSEYQPRSRRVCPDKQPRHISEEGRAQLRRNISYARIAQVRQELERAGMDPACLAENCTGTDNYGSDWGAAHP